METIVVKNGKASLMTDTGNLICTVANDVKNAFPYIINEQVIITHTNGKVYLYTKGGNLLRLISENAESAVMDSNQILVKLINGKTEVRTMWGNMLRYL